MFLMCTNNRGGMRRGGGGWMITLGVCVVGLLLFVGESECCPLVCICKWKGGKQSVTCRNQGLDTLPDGIDPETQVLDVSGNKLGFLPRDAFRKAGLLNLQRIYLSSSRLTQIDPSAFSELINLVELDLSDNQLTTIPSQSFKSTPFIRDLNLGGNPIKRLKNGAFRHLSQLVKLDVSRCELVEVEDQAFAHLQQLETLKINSNILTRLTNTTVRSLSLLHEMELHDNPWDCDCHLGHLKLWIETKKIPHPVSPSCHSPTRISGRKFSELPLSEFACPPLLIPGPRHLSVTEGDNATFDCLFEALPQPQIRWYLFGRPILNNTLLSFSRKFVIFETHRGSALTLTSTNAKDGGEFFCVVENAAGFVEANFTLEILPQAPFSQVEGSQLLFAVLGILTILALLLFASTTLFLCYRRRRRNKGGTGGGHGHGQQSLQLQHHQHRPPEMLTPVKPPRINYDYGDINPGALVGGGGGGVPPLNHHANGFAKMGKGGEDNPDLILETNNSNSSSNMANYQEEESLHSLHSELNWEQQSYRNLGYATEPYPVDYGLPIIHENSVYSDSSYYGGGSVVNLNGGLGLGGPPPPVLSGVWNKNKVGARITAAPNARDSPDEGYQEGYVGTDV